MNQSIIHINASEFIELTWEKSWSDFTILQNGQIIGKIPDKEDLKVARTFRTKSGKLITPILRDGHLEIWCDGRDLVSGMGSGNQNHFATACKAMKFIGIGLLALGVILFLAEYPIAAVVAFIAGPIYLGLAWKADKTRNTLYLKIGLGLLVFIPVGGRNNIFMDAVSQGIQSPTGDRLNVNKK